MLLVCPRQYEALDQIAIHVAHGAVTIVDFLPLRAAVTAHGHPARIDDRPAFLGLMPDDGRQRRQRNILRGANPTLTITRSKTA
jgi:hypothetical protein